jgi:hypothetical protein
MAIGHSRLGDGLLWQNIQHILNIHYNYSSPSEHSMDTPAALRPQAPVKGGLKQAWAHHKPNLLTAKSRAKRQSNPSSCGATLRLR